MNQLLIYAGADPYEHVMRLEVSRYGESDDRCRERIASYKAAFNEKTFSVLHVLWQRVEPEKGTIEVVLNEYGKHPLKTRIEINAKAKPATPLKQKPMQWAELVGGVPQLQQDDLHD